MSRSRIRYQRFFVGHYTKFVATILSTGLRRGGRVVGRVGSIAVETDEFGRLFLHGYGGGRIDVSSLRVEHPVVYAFHVADSSISGRDRASTLGRFFGYAFFVSY